MDGKSISRKEAHGKHQNGGRFHGQPARRTVYCRTPSGTDMTAIWGCDKEEDHKSGRRRSHPGGDQTRIQLLLE